MDFCNTLLRKRYKMVALYVIRWRYLMEGARNESVTCIMGQILAHNFEKLRGELLPIKKSPGRYTDVITRSPRRRPLGNFPR